MTMAHSSVYISFFLNFFDLRDLNPGPLEWRAETKTVRLCCSPGNQIMTLLWNMKKYEIQMFPVIKLFYGSLKLNK